jgi:hypothetical protein
MKSWIFLDQLLNRGFCCMELLFKECEVTWCHVRNDCNVIMWVALEEQFIEKLQSRFCLCIKITTIIGLVL